MLSFGKPSFLKKSRHLLKKEQPWANSHNERPSSGRLPNRLSLEM